MAHAASLGLTVLASSESLVSEKPGRRCASPPASLPLGSRDVDARSGRSCLIGVNDTRGEPRAGAAGFGSVPPPLSFDAVMPHRAARLFFYIQFWRFTEARRVLDCRIDCDSATGDLIGAGTVCGLSESSLESSAERMLWLHGPSSKPLPIGSGGPSSPPQTRIFQKLTSPRLSDAAESAGRTSLSTPRAPRLRPVTVTAR